MDYTATGLVLLLGILIGVCVSGLYRVVITGRIKDEKND